MTIRAQFDLGPYIRDLEKVAKRAIPHALRNFLNHAAFEGRKLWQQEAREKLTLRNEFTTRRMFVDKAKGIEPRRMQARIIDGAGYLHLVEYGGTEHRAAVPTPPAAGLGRGAKRTKVVRRGFKVGAIALADRFNAGSRQQRNAAAIRMAIAKGKRFVYLETAKRKGLFLLKGGKRKPRVEMLHDTTTGSHRIPRTPTLGPAISKLKTVAPKLMKAAVVDQLRRAKAFGY
ncbi:MAG TPA: hypothetical protein VJN18_32155 [Polyangiaceae bacterium]|nr:hypothetical protein [Polyangiaceae bacterium]